MVDVLREKYKKTDEEAELFASFLSPMLEPDPSLRSTAKESKSHPWLKITHKDWEELLQSEKEWIGEMDEASVEGGGSKDDLKAEGEEFYYQGAEEAPQVD